MAVHSEGNRSLREWKEEMCALLFTRHFIILSLGSFLFTFYSELTFEKKLFTSTTGTFVTMETGT